MQTIRTTQNVLLYEQIFFRAQIRFVPSMFATDRIDGVLTGLPSIVLPDGTMVTRSSGG